MNSNWCWAVSSRDLGVVNRLLLHADQQLDLADLVIAGLGQVQGLGGLDDKNPGRFQVAFGDFDPCPSRLGLGQLGVGQPALGPGCVIGARHLVGFHFCGRVLSGQLRPPGVFLLGQHEVGLGDLNRGLGLLDGFVDFIGGQLQGIFRPRLLGLGRVQGLPGNIDLQGDLLLELGQSCFLPFQLGIGKIQLAARLLHLIAVMDRFNFDQDLALLHAIVFLDKEPNDAPGNHFRRDVDDVGLDEGIFGDRVGLAVSKPVHAEDSQHKRDPGHGTPDDPPDKAPGRGRRRGRGDRRSRRRRYMGWIGSHRASPVGKSP